MPQSRHRVLIPLAAFLAVLPLLLNGPTCGHDFDFHLLSWLEAATQFAHGQYPHWAYTPAFNAGEPRFLFYPPISWTLGALLTLILPIQYAGTAFTFLALTLSGFTAHRLARTLTPDPSAATLAALIYALNPYMLFTAYERSAFAELLAAAFLPLLFQAALAPRPKIHQIAGPIALLWLTNAPAAVMGCYALAILVLTRLILGCPMITKRSEVILGSVSGHPARLTAATTAGTLLGLALPAFYLVPAAYEQRWVQITLATIEGMRPQDHFLFHRMPSTSPDDLFHNAVVRTASEVALILLAGILITAIMRSFGGPILPGLFRRAKVPAGGTWPVGREGGVSSKARPHSLSSAQLYVLAPLTLLIAVLLTPISQPLWTHTPKLAFLQFPWRLSALLAVILLILITPLLNFRRSTLVALPIAALLIYPAYTTFHQPCDATDTPTARAALFHSPLGTEPTDEYTPVTATDPDALKPSAPSYWLATEPDAHAPPTGVPGQSPDRLTLNLSTPEFLTLNRRDYPEWILTLNGQPAPLSPRADGLLAAALPAGTDTIAISWHRTPDQTAGMILSLFALAIFAALLLRRRKAAAPFSKQPDLNPGPDLTSFD